MKIVDVRTGVIGTPWRNLTLVELCTDDGQCAAGLLCCYPCGIDGCDFVCEPTCSPGTPGCVGGCIMRI